MDGHHRHAPFEDRHQAVAARLGRARQGGRAGGAALRNRGDRGRPLRQRAGDAGRASQPCHQHARSPGFARADRARGPRPDRPRDRGDRDRRTHRARGRGLARDPDRPRHPADDGPRRHPPPRRRDARPADLALSLRLHRGRVPRRGRRDRHALRGQAGDVVVGQGPERGEEPRRCATRLGTRPGRRPRRWRHGHRRGLHRLRVRDHAAHRAPPRRHLVLRANRPSADRRRLPRVVAAAADAARRARARRGHRRQGDGRARRATACSGSSCS